MTTPGPVVLVASGEGGTLAAMAARARKSLATPTPRVAVSYAPVEGDREGMRFMSGRMPRLFPGATLEAIEDDRRVVERADLVFVSGGDPVHGARVLERTGAAAWLRDASARGVPVMGVSAGAILLGDWWVTWPSDDSPPEAAELVACAGVVPGHAFDTHDEEGGWEELHALHGLLAGRPGATRLLGIPTGGALVFEGGAMQVVGPAPFSL